MGQPHYRGPAHASEGEESGQSILCSPSSFSATHSGHGVFGLHEGSRKIAKYIDAAKSKEKHTRERVDEMLEPMNVEFTEKPYNKRCAMS
ncbi:hypothetical protein AMTR_s00030p00181390 [Amborella trichopoda]|uniref:Uncharacterized protein n=1 Tax=Amborella trichopoda TaxID=13333 RepID=U5D6Y0_AMBTC|nr:hypothetical protein AMTR_s00030p00181390 [Amborella trichopoda]